MEGKRKIDAIQRKRRDSLNADRNWNLGEKRPLGRSKEGRNGRTKIMVYVLVRPASSQGMERNYSFQRFGKKGTSAPHRIRPLKGGSVVGSEGKKSLVTHPATEI